MIPDAEATTGAVQAVPDDPRATAMGRALRATAMDELPQLWNIFRGDMSFVGPRALRPGELERGGNGRVEPLHAVPGYGERASVRPGLTGLAQIYAPRDVARRHKFPATGSTCAGDRSGSTCGSSRCRSGSAPEERGNTKEKNGRPDLFRSGVPESSGCIAATFSLSAPARPA